jgi:hypothetical protein
MPTGEARISESVVTNGASTLFEDTRWQMTREELLKIYGNEVGIGVVPRFAGGSPPILLRREIEGVEVEVALHVRQNGLEMIEVSSVHSYEDVMDCRIAAGKVAAWIQKRAGVPTETSSFGTVWRLPNVHIEAYCEDSVGAVFEPAQK